MKTSSKFLYRSIAALVLTTGAVFGSIPSAEAIGGGLNPVSFRLFVCQAWANNEEQNCIEELGLSPQEEHYCSRAADRVLEACLLDGVLEPWFGNL